MEIKCPNDLNQFLLGEPIFENTFPEEECEKRKFYGDCFHCFATAIAKRDQQIKALGDYSNGDLVVKQDENKKENKGVLEQIAEKQNTLLASAKAWSEYIDKNGYVN